MLHRQITDDYIVTSLIELLYKENQTAPTNNYYWKYNDL